ncbi:MAG: DNA mismatch repair protein, partial [Bacteroidota bacterium]
LSPTPHCCIIAPQGHLLILGSTCSANFLSNMSGKSTFLRTVGVNLVLAHLGAPVCAQQSKFSITDIFTSMRTSDNLEESVSSFYAELKRIERLLQMVKEKKKVFFFLDEILRGTNTHDRQLGARSLIKQLEKEGCLGLVSTHDIALGDLGVEKEGLKNWNFSSEVIDGELDFDYKIKEGVCKSFNASELMARIGIDLEK